MAFDPSELFFGVEHPRCAPAPTSVSVVSPSFYIAGGGAGDRDHRLDRVVDINVRNRVPSIPTTVPFSVSPWRSPTDTLVPSDVMIIATTQHWSAKSTPSIIMIHPGTFL